MKKLTKILSIAIAFVCISLCFVGCSFDSKPTLSRIDIKGSIQTEYALNEALDLNGAKLMLTYSDDSQKELELTQSMVTNFNTTTAGNKTMTISYKEKTLQIDYVVNAFMVGNKRVKFGEYYQTGIYNKDQNGNLTLTEDGSYTYQDTTIRLILNSNFTGTFFQANKRGGEMVETSITWEIQVDKIVLENENDLARVLVTVSVTDNGELRIDIDTSACILSFHNA